MCRKIKYTFKLPVYDSYRRKIDCYDRSHFMKLYVFAFNPDRGVAYLSFLKILKSRATLIFQVNARLSCTTDGDITI